MCVVWCAEPVQLVPGGAIQSAGVQCGGPQGCAGGAPHVCQPHGTRPRQSGSAACHHLGKVLSGMYCYSLDTLLLANVVLQHVTTLENFCQVCTGHPSAQEWHIYWEFSSVSYLLLLTQHPPAKGAWHIYWRLCVPSWWYICSTMQLSSPLRTCCVCLSCCWECSGAKGCLNIVPAGTIMCLP